MAACDICEIVEYCNEGKFPEILEPLAACEYDDGCDYVTALSEIEEVFRKNRSNK
jgi:hypothetical protein